MTTVNLENVMILIANKSNEELKQMIILKLEHLHERIDQPPIMIADQIRFIAESRIDVSLFF